MKQREVSIFKHNNLEFCEEQVYDKIVELIYSESIKKHEKNNSDFRATLSSCLKSYVSIIETTTLDKDKVKEVGDICFKIKDTIASSYSGLHNQAYSRIQNLLNKHADLFLVEVYENSEFYRMRVCNKRKNLQRADIFHVPLNLRRCIKTQRFSTPGYPCLYLGESLYVCWEEMDMPSSETTLIAGFRNTQSFKVIDLRVPLYKDFKDNQSKYLFLFPLIIASSIPVLNRDDIFKPEYILSQLIVEWVIKTRGEKSVIGVYYTSVFKNSRFFSSLDREWNNLAIPVQVPLYTGQFCPKLSDLFELTMPTCYEYEHVKGNIDAVGIWSNGPKRCEDDYKKDYYLSQFSRLEELLLTKNFNKVSVNDLD